jgi:hypothetical protein
MRSPRFPDSGGDPMAHGIEIDWAGSLRQLQRDFNKAMAPIIERYGLEGAGAAAASFGWDIRQPKEAGRPLAYDLKLLRDIWLFIKLGARATNLSVLTFCNVKAHEFPIGLYGVGRADDKISGATLRRRFYAAEQLLGCDNIMGRHWERDLEDLNAMLDDHNRRVISSARQSRKSETAANLRVSARHQYRSHGARAAR